LDDLRVSKLGGIVRVLSLVHPKHEVREAAERLLGRWKRMVLREVFPLPRPTEMAREASGSGSGGVDASAEEQEPEQGGADREPAAVAPDGQQREGACSSEEPEETYGYDVEAARKAAEGTEVAPEELIRLEEEDAAYERMLERMVRVEADPLCSSSSDEEAYSESDMWSPGMDRKRRARERARLQSKKGQESKRAKQSKEAGEVDTVEEGAAAPCVEKPRLSRAFVNLFAGGKKKKESAEPGQVLDKTQDGSPGGPYCSLDEAAKEAVVLLTDESR